MATISRIPRLRELRPFVKRVWASETPAGASAMERVLPTGTMHLVIRLSDEPLVLFDDPSGTNRRSVGHATVGGARSTFYVRSVADPSRSVGAQLWPGAGPALLGVPAAELAEQHTRLDDVWGRHAVDAREQLLEAGSLAAELELFEALLLARLGRPSRHAGVEVHPALREALARFEQEDTVRVADVARDSGYSQRAFLTIFRGGVGLGPKTYARVCRFQRALERLQSARVGLAELAADAGYADQAHLCREFSALAGLSPATYRALTPRRSNHVQVPR